MVSRAPIILLLLQCIAFSSCSACSGAKCLLPSDYDRRLSPKHEEPIEIELGIFVESFGEVDVVQMEFETFGYITQTWTDHRLAKLNITPIILERDDVNLIWLPDLYCINCKESNLDNGRNNKQGMVRIDKDGKVYMSFMAATVSSCTMDLRNFPFDKQQCSLLFSSYAYNSTLVSYKWAREPTVQKKFMDQFVVTGEEARTFIQKYMLGNFTISEASFTFERRVGFYILQLYIPTTMLVCLSWTMFCLNYNHAGERITIGVTLFLTMIFINGQANTSLPKVSYIKSIDIFIVFSLAEILLIIIESIVVTKIITRKEKKKKNKKGSRHGVSLESSNVNCQGSERRISIKNEDQGPGILERKTSKCREKPDSQHMSEWMPIILNGKDISTTLKHNAKTEKWTQKELKSSVDVTSGLSNWCAQRFIEKSSLVLFPLSYISFSIWYWLTYFHQTIQTKT